MKKPDRELEHLLEDTLCGSAGDPSPSLGCVLEMVRRERRRRGRVRGTMAGVLGVLAAGVLLWPMAEPQPAPAPVAGREPAGQRVPVMEGESGRIEALQIRRIDDDQLMALLEGTPAASDKSRARCLSIATAEPSTPLPV